MTVKIVQLDFSNNNFVLGFSLLVHNAKKQYHSVPHALWNIYLSLLYFKLHKYINMMVGPPNLTVLLSRYYITSLVKGNEGLGIIAKSIQ